jgi:hypothetical protein
MDIHTIIIIAILDNRSGKTLRFSTQAVGNLFSFCEIRRERN